ncbi:endothelin-converting enzyme 1 [Trichonephila clavipes]|nr:endothelin-converting enzyme 1 [Trichonephila clavipes]
MEEVRDRRKKGYDKNAIKREFQQGDAVLVLSLNQPHKLAPQWKGPALRYIIAHLDDLSHFFRVLKLSHPDLIPLNADHKIGLSKWEHCTEWIARYMSYPLGQVYVRKRLSEKHMEDIRSIVRTFVQDAGYYILKQRWMKKNMRKKFATSIENLKNSIEHYVHFLRNGTKFSFYMKDFHPRNESFLENAMDYRKLTFRFYLLNFRALEDEGFLTDPFIVNAYHSPGILDLRFGIFLPPVYQYGRPRLLNIATMGTTIGHELGHEIVAFLEDPENFENDTLQIYSEKKKCLEDQYSNFDVKKIGQKVKGKQTIHENLADLIGIEITQQIYPLSAPILSIYPSRVRKGPDKLDLTGSKSPSSHPPVHQGGP